MKLENRSVIAWLQEYNIKTEAGIPLDFYNHMYMVDIYRDLSPKQALLKAAQITASTCFSLKVPWVVKNIGLDAIYTLPTEDDRNAFVSGKVNRIIAQNPIMQQWTKDKDSIEQKQIGDNLINFRGTWTQKAAIMIPSDLNIYDEVDASKLSVIEQYSTRLQHSKYQWEWYFSHPSSENTGVHKFWLKSDQKHWFHKCSRCNAWNYLEWPASIVEGQYICRSCKQPLREEDRRKGKWVKKYKDKEFSGYWIPLLIAPWVTAEKVMGYYADKSEEYFYNKVLGLPFVGGGNKLTKQALLNNLTSDVITPDSKDRAVMGVDTGLRLDYVMGSEKGLFYQGDAKDYDELDAHMKRWPRMIAVVDAGGDLIGSRKFKERWPGRVFLCVTGGDKKNTDEPVWNDDERMVVADRNKIIQLVVDEFTDGKIPLQGDENDWYDYWMDWNNLHRIKVIDPITSEFKGNKWVRNGRDHRALATVYWRVGMTRFSGVGSIYNPTVKIEAQKGYEIEPDNIIRTDLTKLFKPEEQEDWRV